MWCVPVGQGNVWCSRRHLDLVDGPCSVNNVGTPCELTRAFRNENLWIGTCFQESLDSCIQEAEWPASPVFMRVLGTVTRAREFNFLNSLTARC